MLHPRNYTYVCGQSSSFARPSPSSPVCFFFLSFSYSRSLHTHPTASRCNERRREKEREKRARNRRGGEADGELYRLSTRAGKRARLDGFKHGLPLFPTTSTTPYLGHCWRVVKMERYRGGAVAGVGVSSGRYGGGEAAGRYREKFPRFLKLEGTRSS